EFFQGHFPGNPVMPGVLVLEAMAQVAGIGLLGVVPEKERKLLYLSGVDRCKFRRPVVPGDQLRIEALITSLKARVCKCHARATGDGNLGAGADMLSVLVDRPGAPSCIRAPSSRRGPSSARASRSGRTPSSATGSCSAPARPSEPMRSSRARPP